MKKNEINKAMIEAFDSQVPDEFDKILSKCKKTKKERKTIVKEKNKKFNWWLPLATAMLILIVLTGGIYHNYSLNNTVDSIIDIDVNPSIELQVNKKEKIIKCVPLNEDAKNILADMDFKDVDIDVALNAIIGSMVTKGYIDDLSNSILISVDNKDEVKAEELRKKLVTKIDNILNTDKIKGSVLSQTISNKGDENSNKIDELAKKYNISTGKAKLILNVLENNSLLQEEDLVNLTINEINVLTQGKKNSITTIEKDGNASTKSYIGEEKAKDIALNHSKVKQYYLMEIEFDADNGVLVYDVEFKSDSYEYDYEINALDGTIISSHKEKDDDYVSNNKDNNSVNNNNNNSDNSANSSNNNYISKDEAKNIALNHAKVSNPQKLEIELDKEDNEYSVEFKYNGKEYDYEINATTGKIIDYEIENID